MKLYYFPGACSLGIHVLLEEIGKPYELVKLDLKGGEQRRPPFSELNPKGKVPTLQRDDGSVVTEYPVIAHWLASRNPEAGLLPADEETALRAAEATDYCVSTIHMQGFGPLFRNANAAPDDEAAAKAVGQGRELIDRSFAVMDKQMTGRDWVAGAYSMADSALFYVEFWAVKRMGMTLPANLAGHFNRMMARPAVQRALEQEGLAAG